MRHLPPTETAVSGVPCRPRTGQPPPASGAGPRRCRLRRRAPSPSAMIMGTLAASSPLRRLHGRSMTHA
eukprot:5170694-Prymnesium_polylepis.1